MTLLYVFYWRRGMDIASKAARMPRFSKVGFILCSCDERLKDTLYLFYREVYCLLFVH